MRIRNVLHSVVRKKLAKVRRFVRKVPNLGIRWHCPVCRMWSRRFGEYGIVPRKDAKCEWCGSLERHRLVWLYFRRMTDLFKGCSKSMLHIAPERMFGKMLKRHLGAGYLTADLHNPSAMVRMDITDIGYPDETFDVIYCGHVLEHVLDDRRAMDELHRVLKSDGWAVFLVPITADRTFEDPSITDPSDRLRVFGHKSHVRIYGRDFVERLKEAGFKVKATVASDFLTAKEIQRIGVGDAPRTIYECTKR
jgi:SAM-dependent methyltransferase